MKWPWKREGCGVHDGISGITVECNLAKDHNGWHVNANQRLRWITVDSKREGGAV